MLRNSTLLLLTVLLVGSAAAGPRIIPLRPEETAHWTRHLCPLPKHIDLHGRMAVEPCGIRLECAEDDPVSRQACAELREALQLPRFPNCGASVRVVLEIGGPFARSLARLRNRDQAYRILTAPDGSEIRLSALSPAGLYYGAKTLQQLVAAWRRPGQVVLPAVRVTDWPDLEDRGTWGADNFRHLRWMADHKLNIVEQISALQVMPDGRGVARLKPGREAMVELGPRLAIKPVPVVLHLEQLSGKGLFEAYPQLRGQGGQEGNICYARPEFVQVLADWICELGALPSVDSVDVWMTENLHGQGGCRCDVCRQVERPVQEARVIVAAWQEARRRGCDVGLRVLTSEETRRCNREILDVLPPDVKLWYYDSLLTYNSMESSMIEDYLASSARSGRWIGVCPSLVTIHMLQPFTSPHFIHYRMREFAGKGVSGLLGFVTPRLPYGAFNLSAAAEWAWNASGRSTREFAASWAVRKGFPEPELFADWTETIGPVTWDLYGSAWPTNRLRGARGSLMEALANGDLPELGFVRWGCYPEPWGDIKTPGQLAADLASVEKAYVLARRLGAPAVTAETAVIGGYMKSLAALWKLRGLVVDGKIRAESESAARQGFTEYLAGLDQSMSQLPIWARAAVPDMNPEPFLKRPLETLLEMRTQAASTAQQLGLGETGTTPVPGAAGPQ